MVGLGWEHRYPRTFSSLPIWGPSVLGGGFEADVCVRHGLVICASIVAPIRLSAWLASGSIFELWVLGWHSWKHPNSLTGIGYLHGIGLEPGHPTRKCS